jgi:KUP system potassium uptake protein
MMVAEIDPKGPDPVAPDARPAREQTAEEDTRRTAGRLLTLGLGALGVVYGDIGTSPLYAVRQCFLGRDPASLGPLDVLHVLSLIFWTLIIVISVKYLLVVMRADNRGEGGILALLALLDPWRSGSRGRRRLLLGVGVFGAALLLGDGMITPAISVLSAVEGLAVAAPVTADYVVPATVAILIGLFLLQRRGTGGVGALFGPVMLVWFTVLALLGIREILRTPAVLGALNPWYAVTFFLDHDLAGLALLGAVFLVVTGGEALYADMGHFGRKPIRYVWYGLALPGLVLNYFGQGALILRDPAAAAEPFYRLAPHWALYPLVLLATIATVIASQAVISGAFSLVRQAILLGECPRMNIVQTSSEEIGQIYIPAANYLLMVCTIALVLGFRSSSGLAGAYGVAVSTTMVITTFLAFLVMRGRWNWPLPVALGITILFLVPDLAFFGANLTKIAEGGWIPLLVATLAFTAMATWRRGREILFARLSRDSEPIEDFIARIKAEPPHRVKGTAVFMTEERQGTPPMLLHHLEHNQVLHEQVVLMTVVIEDVPRIPAAQRVEVAKLGQGVYRAFAHYGFMQIPNVPVALRLSESGGLRVDPEHTTFYLGRETLIPSDRLPGMMAWREKLFAFMSRNAARATQFYRIPPERVIELGIQVEL